MPSSKTSVSKGLLLEKSNEAGWQPGEAIIHLWSASALAGADIHHLTYTAEHWRIQHNNGVYSITLAQIYMI